MMRNSRFLVALLLLVGILGGCATAERNMQVSESPTVESLMAEARAASEAGRNERAAAVLKEAAAVFPAEKRPWLALAQIHFDAAEYGEAIRSAEEAQQRDPEDQVAASIIAVSGLRLSTKALADLSRQNNLSGSLRTEANGLATLLRETLGEPVLVPARTRTVAPPQRSTVVAVPVKRRSARSQEESASANPFGALK